MDPAPEPAGQRDVHHQVAEDHRQQHQDRDPAPGLLAQDAIEQAQQQENHGGVGKAAHDARQAHPLHALQTDGDPALGIDLRQNRGEVENEDHRVVPAEGQQGQQQQPHGEDHQRLDGHQAHVAAGVEADGGGIIQAADLADAQGEHAPFGDDHRVPHERHADLHHPEVAIAQGVGQEDQRRDVGQLGDDLAGRQNAQVVQKTLAAVHGGSFRAGHDREGQEGGQGPRLSARRSPSDPRPGPAGPWLRAHRAGARRWGH